MSSLSSLIAADGVLRLGSAGADVRVLQSALSSAGYRADVTADMKFTDDTDYWVRRFQTQHGLSADGIVGSITAALLDAPHDVLVSTATPAKVYSAAGMETPHDDTASLIAFYGKPWEDESLMTRVQVPFPMSYREDNGSDVPVHSVTIHGKVAPMLAAAFGKIAEAAKADPSVLRHVTHFSGSYNYRPIRGSSRLSCHAFAAALDFDAEHLPFTYSDTPVSEMPAAVVDAFRSSGFFWGNDYRSRKDPMHFQAAHE